MADSIKSTQTSIESTFVDLTLVALLGLAVLSANKNAKNNPFSEFMSGIGTTITNVMQLATKKR